MDFVIKNAIWFDKETTRQVLIPFSCLLPPVFNIQFFAVRKMKTPSKPSSLRKEINKSLCIILRETKMTEKQPIQTLSIEISSTKSQIPDKFQFPNPKTQINSNFRISNSK